jgi:Xaa-Pro aminopeptidase
MAQAANDSVMRCIAAMKPGTPISRISRVAEDTIRDAGYGQYVVHSSGHGIGLDVVEYPMIHHSEETVLEPGMTFAVEQGVYPFRPQDGAEGIYWCFRTEDVVVVTETGAEFLSGPGPALIEL